MSGVFPLNSDPEWVPPKWTVFANAVGYPKSKWIGSSWEFFDDEQAAQARYDELVEQRCYPTKRPYYRFTDEKHLHHLQNNGLYGSEHVVFKVDVGCPGEAIHTGRIRDVYVAPDGTKLYLCISDQDGIPYGRTEEQITQLGVARILRTMGSRL